MAKNQLAEVSPTGASGLRKLFPFIPIIIAICVFSAALNNFFVYDDFIWLYRGKTLWKNCLQMFYPDVIYFDPIVYLMFLADYAIAGSNPMWYQLVDVAIHAFNGFLVYRFAKMLSEDERGALYGSTLFASSCIIADAVIWPSSRVDLVSVTFCLGTLIQFLKFLRSDENRFLWFSCLLFVLAMGAKGTPAVIPLLLLWLIVQEKKGIRQTASMIPFGAVIIVYAALLKLTMHHASLPLDSLHLNIGNLVLSFCSLFIREGTLKFLTLTTTALLLFIAVSALGLSAWPLKTSLKLRRTGYFFLMAAILPVLAVTDFKLVTEYSNPYLLLLSPSHRLYLASIGTALLGGGLLRSIEMLIASYYPRSATVIIVVVLTGIVTSNALQVRERDLIWESAGDWARKGFNGLTAYRGQVSDGSQIGLINFPGSRGFTSPMVKLALDVNDITLPKNVEMGFSSDPEVLRKAEKSFLFVLGSDGHVYDKSQQYRQQLLLNRMAVLHPGNPEYSFELQGKSAVLQQDIMNILEK